MLTTRLTMMVVFAPPDLAFPVAHIGGVSKSKLAHQTPNTHDPCELTYSREAETAYCMKGRYQLANFAKFNRPDPMRDWDWENPSSINLYQYVRNNPIDSWDPDGFCKGPCKGGHDYSNSKPSGPKAEAMLRQSAIATGRDPDQVVADYHAAIDSGPTALEVAAMFIEPLDYVLTGVDIAQNGVQTEHLVAIAAPIISFGLLKAFSRFASKADNAAGEVVEKSVENAVENQKTFQTYTKTNPETGEVYTGRTSGTGTPEQNVARKDAGHHKNKDGFGPAELDQSSTNKDAIRGREQQLIQANGGAQSQGGTSGNAINGIGPNNKKKEQYLNEAKSEFEDK